MHCVHIIIEYSNAFSHLSLLTFWSLISTIHTYVYNHLRHCYQLSQFQLLQQTTTDLGNFSNKRLFLTVLEGGQFRIKKPADQMSGEHSLPGLHTAIFLPKLHMADRSSASSFHKGNDPTMRPHSHDYLKNAPT